MPELKWLYESLGMTDVVTYIQSGNVVFDCAENDPIKITRIIEKGIMHSLGSEVRVILRDKHSIKKILENNPFVNQRNAEPEKLYVTFLSDTPAETILQNIAAPSDGSGRAKTPNSKGRGETGNHESRSAIRINSNKSMEGDEFMIYDKEVYLFCPNGYGKTKFSNTFFEKKLSLSATTRNWKTVNALYEITERR